MDFKELGIECIEKNGTIILKSGDHRIDFRDEVELGRFMFLYEEFKIKVEHESFWRFTDDFKVFRQCIKDIQIKK